MTPALRNGLISARLAVASRIDNLAQSHTREIEIGPVKLKTCRHDGVATPTPRRTHENCTVGDKALKSSERQDTKTKSVESLLLEEGKDEIERL